jgi:hypothetical protein
MSAAPLIRTPQLQGGTLYTFSSAARDLSRTLNNDNLRFVFSKFVLLNLPNMQQLDVNTFGNYNNYIQFNTIDGVIQNQAFVSDDNINFSQGLQNYVFNLENLILNDTSYDQSTNQSVAERVFFKWLKETGALRFRAATSTEKSQPLVLSNTPRFVEEDQADTGTVQYSRVVKYIGDIDIINNVGKNGDAYTELYIYVPTEAGATPTVLFKALDDNNYGPDMRIEGSTEFINGRTSATVSPDGLDLRAFYDYDDALSGSGSGGYTDSDANWMAQTTPPTEFNSYFTQPTSFVDPTNTDIQKYNQDYGVSPAGAAVAYRRSKLDGISVDFDAADYYGITNDPAINTIAQFNSTPNATNFDFNAILLYYDIFDPSNLSTKATNLYGILIVDNITDTPNGGYIQRLPKYKPNSLTKENGNSYGFKVNLRFDASLVAGGVNTIVNEYNTFSMGLFSDAVAELQDAVNTFSRQATQIRSLQTQVDALTTRSYALDSIAELQAEFDALNLRITNSQVALASSRSLLDLIAKNSDDLLALMNNRTSINVQYNTDVLQAGPGILLNKNTPNKVIIQNTSQDYTLPVISNNSGVQITEVSPINLNSSNNQVNFVLTDFTNMARVYTESQTDGTPIPAISNIVFRIDDSQFKFKTGQVVRIVFPLDTNFGGYDISIVTDSVGAKGFGNYGINCATIVNSELSTRPIIELICTDGNLYTFTYDVLR